MLRTKLRKIGHLRLAQLLQLVEFPGAGFDIALQQLADHLQAHLKADEALQRAVVKIGGDALALGFPRELRLRPDHHVVAQRGGHAFFEITLIEAHGRGRAAGGDHGPHQIPVAAGGQDQRNEKRRREGDRGTHQIVQQHGGSQQIAAGQSRLPVTGSLPGPDGEVGGVRHDRGGRARGTFVAHGEHRAQRIHGVGGDQRGHPVLLEPGRSNVSHRARHGQHQARNAESQPPMIRNHQA